jgi:hypothetical protein
MTKKLRESVTSDIWSKSMLGSYSLFQVKTLNKEMINLRAKI